MEKFFCLFVRKGEVLKFFGLCFFLFFLSLVFFLIGMVLLLICLCSMRKVGNVWCRRSGKVCWWIILSVVLG